MVMKAAIFGCSGLTLTIEEKSFFKVAKPWGFILFKRNIEHRDQVHALCQSLRELTGRADTPILIDQEGGRVQRMGPPNWQSYPAGRTYGDLYLKDRALGLEMVNIGARLIAADLREVGITVNCLPVLDVPVSGAHDVIGSRAYGETPEIVAALGRAAAEGLLNGGVLPVIKHVPGHGRAGVDSHLSLPVVDNSRGELEADFKPFRALSDMPLAMTAHVIYSALDPVRPATISPVVIRELIRNDMAYDGLIMSDDLSMKALSGTLGERTSAAFLAGCDVVLHCNGVMEEMQAVVEQTPDLKLKSASRAETALARIKHDMPSVDLNALRHRFNTTFALDG